MMRIGLVFGLCLTFAYVAHSQGPFRYQMEMQAYGSTTQAPFWMRANQHGSVPLGGPSVSAIGFVHKEYDSTRRKLLDWGVGLEGRANAGKGSNLILVQGYAKVRLAMFEVRAGRWKSQTGLTDTLLTSGSFSMSGNALGVPQVQLSIPEFYSLPFTNDWVAIKGNFSHGWLGTMPIQTKKWVDRADTYFHQASLYGRIGQPSGKFRLYGGFNHEVFWGNEREVFGPTFTLTNWEAYKSVVTGSVWAQSKVGNHLGSIDVGLDIDFANVRLMAYRQFFYEVGALAHLGNVRDGLNGLSLTNRREPAGGKGFHWKKILVELMYSKNQSGELWSPVTPSGAEMYYNHSLYANGWSYKGRGLGNPLFTPAADAKPGQLRSSNNYFINNRIVAFHAGLLASYSGWELSAKATYSRNYGTYHTSGKPFRSAFSQVTTPTIGAFTPVNQFSVILSGQRPLGLRTYWGVTAALDAGKLYTSNAALMGKLGINL